MKVEEERKELEKMLEGSANEIKNNPAEEIPGLHAEPVTDVNFIELKQQCEKDARIMIKNAIAFIIPEDMIESNKYIENKLEVDVITLSGMIYQLRTNEVIQKALIDQLNGGMVNARMFEVFAGMSKTIGDLNKQLIQTVEALKETYKTFKNDVKEQRSEALGPATSKNENGMIATRDGSVITRGTKELINNVKKLKAAESVNKDFLDDANLIPNINLDENEK